MGISLANEMFFPGKRLGEGIPIVAIKHVPSAVNFFGRSFGRFMVTISDAPCDNLIGIAVNARITHVLSFLPYFIKFHFENVFGTLGFEAIPRFNGQPPAYRRGREIQRTSRRADRRFFAGIREDGQGLFAMSAFLSEITLP